MSTNTLETFNTLAATDVADALPHEQIMNIGLHSIWTPCPKITGPAHTARCVNGDNTQLHACIHTAPAGSIVVVETDGNDYAVAGGNVCAIAQKNGIAGFIIDGVVRDLAEIRDAQFPVFARGVYPKPGKKGPNGERQVTINCGGVSVSPGDLIVADEEGISVVPKDRIQAVLNDALAKKAQAEQKTLEQWSANHKQKITDALGGSLD